MNLVALSDSIRRWLIVLLLAVAGVAVALAVSSWRAQGRAEQALAAEKARAELRAKGDVPVEPVPDLRPALEKAMAENEAFRDQVQKLQKDLKGAKAQLLVTAATKPAPITGPPRPRPPPGGPCPDCYLARGDQLQLRLALALLGDGRLVTGVAGAMEAWAIRAGEPEPVLLLRQPFEAGLTQALEPARDPSPTRARFALGARGWWKPSDALASTPSTGELNGGLRLFGGWWADAAVRTDGDRAVGVRFEW